MWVEVDDILMPLGFSPKRLGAPPAMAASQRLQLRDANINSYYSS